MRPSIILDQHSCEVLNFPFCCSNFAAVTRENLNMAPSIISHVTKLSLHPLFRKDARDTISAESDSAPILQIFRYETRNSNLWISWDRCSTYKPSRSVVDCFIDLQINFNSNVFRLINGREV